MADTYTQRCKTRIIENGYSPGDYVIKIIVTTSGNANCKEYFKLHVDNQRDNLSMSRLTWLDILAANAKMLYIYPD